MSVKRITGKETKHPRCYVVGGGLEYIQLMYRLGCDGAKGLDDADFVLFTGGEDVCPDFYGEAPMPKTHYYRERDNKEKAVFEAAAGRGLPMVGICRGGQFLNVMNGGKMYQHVNNHTRNHVAIIHVPPFDKAGQCREIEVTSTHHQMMIPTDEAVVLCTALEATEKHTPDRMLEGKNENNPDMEVCFYQDTNCLCFQPHPEVMWAPPECVDFFEECLDNWIYPNILLPEIVQPIKEK